MSDPVGDISRMPRGGHDASWLDRLLQTNLSQYQDRDDADPELLRGLRTERIRVQSFLHTHQHVARLVLDDVADMADPAILQLGADNDEVATLLLHDHPTARLTVSSPDPELVGEWADGVLGDQPRAHLRTLDPTAINAANDEFDLAFLAFGLHHLSAVAGARFIAEGTRVAGELLIIDVFRPPSPLHLVRLAAMAPLAPVIPFVHDELISSLEAYSTSAIRAMAASAAERAGTTIDVDVSRSGPITVVRAARG